jgi:hypothetical protein
VNETGRWEKQGWPGHTGAWNSAEELGPYPGGYREAMGGLDLQQGGGLLGVRPDS